MKVIESVLKLVCYPLAGYALSTGGINTSMWQFWVVMGCLAIIHLSPLLTYEENR